jgi:uncharacterized protein (TIGR02001 family)
VIVPAGQRASRARTGSFLRRLAVRSILFTAGLAFGAPVTAQIGTTVSVFSDDRFRGYSLSDSRPVGILDLSYDAPDGLYGAVSGSIVATRHRGLQPLALQLNGGYAKRLSSSLTLDFGIVHSAYSSYSTAPTGKSYTEAYVGVAGKILSSRISVSPDYFNRGAWTVYSEADASLPAGKQLHFTAHVGMLAALADRRTGESYRPQFDWRLGLARSLGRLSVSVALADTARGRDLDRQRSYRRPVLIVGLTYGL